MASIPSAADYMAALQRQQVRKALWSKRMSMALHYSKYVGVVALIAFSAFLLGRLSAPDTPTIVVPASSTGTLSCEGVDLKDAHDANADGMIDCRSDIETTP
jgi:hypothetical protein